MGTRCKRMGRGVTDGRTPPPCRGFARFSAAGCICTPGRCGRRCRFDLPAFSATAMSAMEVSSVSRCGGRGWCGSRAAGRAAPSGWSRTGCRFDWAWTRTALALRDRMPCSRRAGLVTNRSSPTICTWAPSCSVMWAKPSKSSSPRGSSMEKMGNRPARSAKWAMRASRVRDCRFWQTVAVALRPLAGGGIHGKGHVGTGR